MRTIYALCPNLFDEVGHIVPYHEALQKAAHLNGWGYVNIIPRNAPLKKLPQGWIRSLGDDFWNRKKNIFFRLKMLFLNIRPLRAIFQKIRSDADAVVFLEHFELQNLASILLALVCLKPQFQFWILHRYAYGSSHFKTKIYRFFHTWLEKKLKVVYLTDSERLWQKLQIYFSRSVHIVPIPHTSQPTSSAARIPFCLWCPGSTSHQHKGLTIVQNLSTKLRAPFQLAVGEMLKPYLPASAHLIFLPPLSDAEYALWMSQATFILLPYDAKSYADRTSGIFVEAIVSGAFPLVTRGTWMAYEMQKFGVHTLIVDWEDPDLIQKIQMNRFDSLDLEKMRLFYRNFHTVEKYATTLRGLSP